MSKLESMNYESIKYNLELNLQLVPKYYTVNSYNFWPLLVQIRRKVEDKIMVVEHFFHMEMQTH